MGLNIESDSEELGAPVCAPSVSKDEAECAALTLRDAGSEAAAGSSG